MKILLLAMPDSADWQDHVMRVPNLAIISLAAMVPEHEVRVLDLLVVKENLKKVLDRHLDDFRPELVGLSAMTFQFPTLIRLATYIREKLPTAKIVAGGYHVTLLHHEIATETPGVPLDFMVRGEGELTFRELATALATGGGELSTINGLTWRHADGRWVHNADRDLLELGRLPLPARELRQEHSFHVFKHQADVIETSRGCPLNCNFCSIRQMYGPTFRRRPIDLIMEDIRRVRIRGSRIIFLCDDNITYDIVHFKEVCDAIIANGYNDVDYSIQASAYGIAKNPELVPLMDRANIRVVSLGLESMDPAAIKFMKKATSATLNEDAVRLLRGHNIGVNALFIIGFPDDTPATIRQSFETLLALQPDTLYCQIITPYPKTEVREQLLADGLVENPGDYSKYDGYHCNVRTRHLSRDELSKIYRLENMRTWWPLVSRKNLILKRYFAGFLACELKVVLILISQLFRREPRKWSLQL